MTRILICLLALALSGCGLFTKHVPVVREAPQCDLSKTGLLAGCRKPAEINPGMTFDDLVGVLRQDRDSLENCALRFQDLANALATCNTVIDAHNATLRAINDAEKKK
jgi:hypothetical protein